MSESTPLEVKISQHVLNVQLHCRSNDNEWDFAFLFQVFTTKINEQFKAQNCNCLVLLDNATSHSVADATLVNVGSFKPIKLLLLFLPANCTSVIQPLDQGIITAFKARYYAN